MARNVAIAIAVLVLLGCCGLILFGQIFGDRFDDRKLSRNELRLDGSRLYIRHFPDGKTFDVISGSNGSVQVDVQRLDHGSILVIQDGTKRFEKSGKHIPSAFWSESDQAVFFVLDDYSETFSNRFNNGEIWKWTRKSGFERLLQFTEEDIFSLSKSNDGNYLCLFSSTMGSGAHLMTRLFPIHGGKILEVPVIWHGGTPFANDANQLVIEGSGYRIVDVTKGRIRQGEGGYFEQFVSIKGRIWCLRRVAGVQAAVRLSPVLDKVDKVVDLPRAFSKTER